MSFSAPSSIGSVPVFGKMAVSHPLLAEIVGSVALLLFVTYLYLWPYREWTIPFRNLPGPPAPSLFWGNMRDIIAAPPMALHMKWTEQYGHTIRYRVVGGIQRMFSADPTALGYILQHSDDFIKPERTNTVLTRMLGNGVLTAEGDVHRRQRRVLNPAFGPAAVRDMMPIFWDKAAEFQAKLSGFLEDDSLAKAEPLSPTPAADVDKVPGALKIDMLRYLAKTTLDVIGTAGFGYEFKALEDSDSPLAQAFNKMFSVGQQITPLMILQAFVPGLDWIPSKNRRVVEESAAITRKIGKDMVDQKRQALHAEHNGQVEKGTDIGNDLLARLMKANMAPDLRPDQKLSTDEVNAQITTFMLAGNETSSTSLTWGLYRLGLNPDIQKKLRDELRSVDTDRPSFEELNALPYLDKFVHESLRFDNPVPGTIRVATTDSVIPLGSPVRGRDGTMVESVTIKKGTEVFIPIMVVNRSKAIWGPDADQFNPDRFDKQGVPSQHVPGVYGNLLSFLGGARNCIGYRFALAEIKVMLFMLLRNFSFDELPSKPVIEAKSSIVMRPRVVGEESAGLQMPLLVRPLSSAE